MRKLSFFIFICTYAACAQKRDLSAYVDAISTPPKRQYWEAKGNKNEISAVFSGLFLTYKTFFSSQDQNVCSFTPSCSEYGILAVKRFGMVKGGVLTMDRLTRCNGLSPNKYEHDLHKKLLIDLVDSPPKPITFKEN